MNQKERQHVSPDWSRNGIAKYDGLAIFGFQDGRKPREHNSDTMRASLDSGEYELGRYRVGNFRSSCRIAALCKQLRGNVQIIESGLQHRRFLFAGAAEQQRGVAAHQSFKARCFGNGFCRIVGIACGQ